jgi:hypothetical protein
MLRPVVRFSDDLLCRVDLFQLAPLPEESDAAGSEQVADDTRQLDLTFFQSF